MGDVSRMERSNRFALEFDEELSDLGDKITRADSDDIIRIDGEVLFDPGYTDNPHELAETLGDTFEIPASETKARLVNADLFAANELGDKITADNIVDDMMDAFAERDTEGIAEVFNTICSSDIDPLGDDRYRHSDGGEIDGDHALKIVRDNLTDAMDGHDLAWYYNKLMSDHLVYDTDNDVFHRYTDN